MERFGLAGDEVANGNITFGDPWALVEQPRGLQKWRKSISTSVPPSRSMSAQHLSETPLALFIAEELKLVAARNAKAASRDLPTCRSAAVPCTRENGSVASNPAAASAR